MSDTETLDLVAIGKRLSKRRKEIGFSSLEALADQISSKGCGRPSIAKLSRIETGVQPVPTDILTELAEVTGIPANELRPDLAAKFEVREVAE